MQCEHANCSCDAPEGERWCSDPCRAAARSASQQDTCPCGHAECEQQTG